MIFKDFLIQHLSPIYIGKTVQSEAGTPFVVQKIIFEHDYDGLAIFLATDKYEEYYKEYMAFLNILPRDWATPENYPFWNPQINEKRAKYQKEHCQFSDYLDGGMPEVIK